MGKRLSEDKSEVAQKQKTRKIISLEEKLEIIRKSEDGVSKSKIGLEHKLGESTVRGILVKADEYKTKGKAASNLSCVHTTRNQNVIMIELERLLTIWIADCNQKRIPLSTDLIKEKALSLFSILKKEKFKNETKEFHASAGWFEKFKKRTNLHNVRITGEAADIYLKKIVEEGGYSHEQIFNVDETELFWKRMPTKTFLAKSESSRTGYKAAKDRTLLVGSNSKGNLKLKPMLVYRAQNPRALKGINKELLEVNSEELDLTNLDTQRAYEDIKDCEETVPTRHHKKMTKKKLEEFFRVIEEFKVKCLEADPDEDRSRQICRKIEGAISQYRQLYEEQKNTMRQNTKKSD